MHIAFESIMKIKMMFPIDHLVIAFDHKSWRKSFFEGYKAKTPEELEAKKDTFNTVFEAIDKMKQFFSESTNVTILHAHGCEADDFIARWIQLHRTDHHVIISSDGDYKQLVAENVELYNGVTKTLYNLSGVYFQDGRRPTKTQQVKVIQGEVWKVKCDKKGIPETVEPEWELFMKIMTGDSSDKVPRAAVPYTKTKDLREAFENQNGVKMSNIMSSYREDLEGKPTVKQLFERNEILVDLTKQPDEIKDILDQEIVKSVDRDPVTDTAKSFLSFCRKNRLIRIGENARKFIPILSASYRT